MEKDVNISIKRLYDYKKLLQDAGLLTESNIEDGDETPVKGLTYNSKEAADGTLFVCKGAHFKSQ